MTGNIADILVVVVIGLGIWLGAVKGVIKMALSLCSSLVAVVIAFFVQPMLIPLLKTYTPIFDKLVEIISRNVNLAEVAEKMIQPSEVVGEWKGISPQILGILGKKMGSDSVLSDLQLQISHNLAEIALQILALFLGFILALLLFAVAGKLLSDIGKLPVIKEVNKLAGAIVGGGIGLLVIWIGMLFLNYWFSTGQQMEIYSAIETSLIAKYLYRYNLLVYYLVLLQ